jgi:hypothetical protein
LSGITCSNLTRKVDYADFLERKRSGAHDAGFDADDLHDEVPA